MKWLRSKPKYITIDLDNPEKMKHYERLIILLRLKWICERARCHIARTHKGYHIYIEAESWDFNKSLAIRALLRDDPMRLEIDEKRYHKGLVRWVDTLFECKTQREYSYCEEPLDLETLWREWIVGWFPW